MSDPPVPGERTAMKAGKLQLELVDLDFVEDMARQLQAGLVPPRVADGWRELDPREWVRKYRGAVLRHLVCASREFGAVDPDTGATHWAGVAVNAMICAVLEASALATAEKPAWQCRRPGCVELKHKNAPYCGGDQCLVPS